MPSPEAHGYNLDDIINEYSSHFNQPDGTSEDSPIDPTESAPTSERDPAAATRGEATGHAANAANVNQVAHQKQNKGLKQVLKDHLAVVLLGGSVLVAGAAFGISALVDQNKNTTPPDETAPPAETASIQAETHDFDEQHAYAPGDFIKDSEFRGELPNGTFFDYSQYLDFENKSSDVAFGYDYTDAYGNPELTTNYVMSQAERMPEILADYAHSVFNSAAFSDADRAELGISGMTSAEIDRFMDADPAGGNLQKALLAKLHQTITDSDNARWRDQEATGRRYTDYVVSSDLNGDGKITPDEAQLGFAEKDRYNTKQVVLELRLRDADGNPLLDAYGNEIWVEALTINLYCGGQVDRYAAPVGVEKIEVVETNTGNEEPTTGSIVYETTDTTETTGTGEQGTTGGAIVTNTTPIGESTGTVIVNTDYFPEDNGGDYVPPYVPPVQTQAKGDIAGVGQAVDAKDARDMGTESLEITGQAEHADAEHFEKEEPVSQNTNENRGGIDVGGTVGVGAPVTDSNGLNSGVFTSQETEEAEDVEPVNVSYGDSNDESAGTRAGAEANAEAEAAAANQEAANDNEMTPEDVNDVSTEFADFLASLGQ